MRRAGLLILALVAGALAPATSVSAAAGRHAVTNGSIGIQLLDAPSSRADDPRARIYIVDHVAPGDSLHRRIALTSTSTTPLAVQAYAAAASIGQGQFTGAEGRTENDLSTWITVTPAQLTLPPAGRAIGTVDIRVPAYAAAGEQYAIIWAEVRSPSAPGVVSEVNRVGIRIYLSVGRGGEPPSNFTINSITAARQSDGRPYVTAQVHNTGGRALDLSGQLRLTDGPGSLTAGPFNAVLGTTLGIGQTEPVTVLLDRALPKGPWLARLDLRSGLVRKAATASIRFPDTGAAKPVTARPVGGSTPSWLTIGLSALGLLGLAWLLLVLLKRRSRPPDRRDHDAEVLAAP